jgi:transcriptional regulator with XRE-family HTH domain
MIVVTRMTLGDWLMQQGMSRRAFAARIGCDQSAVTKYVLGRVPRPAIIERIREATGGAVTANDLVSPNVARETRNLKQKPAPAGV